MNGKTATRWGLVLLAVGLMAYGLYAYRFVDTRPDKVWLHRCNSLEKLSELGDRYPNFEVDVCLRDSTLDITHDEDTTFGLTVTPYFHYLKSHPKSHMWMDVKNLTAKNQQLLVDSLQALCQRYDVEPSRLIVESHNWALLGPLTKMGYMTSCYVDYEKTGSSIALLRKVAASGKVKALSMPANWYDYMKEHLGNDHIALLCWWSHRGQYRVMLSPTGRRMLNDPQVKVMLVKEKGHYHR